MLLNSTRVQFSTLAAGYHFQCEYKGKFRPGCEVDHIKQCKGGVVVLAKTPLGYRNFRTADMRNVMVLP